MHLPTKSMFNEESSELTAMTEGTGSLSLSPEKDKSTVHFRLASNQTHFIDHVDDMDDEEIQAIWYDKRDYDAIKNKLIPIIRKMMKGEKSEESNRSTTRGLEYRTRQGALRRQQNKSEGLASVLNEQDRQRKNNTKDDELLAEIYRGATSHCQDTSYALALKDEAFITKDLQKLKKDGFTIIPARSKSGDSKTKKGGINGLFKQVMRHRRPMDHMEMQHRSREMGPAA